MSDITRTIGHALRVRRAELRQTQAQAAAVVGVSATSWRAWESDAVLPSVERLPVLRGWLDVDGGRLLDLIAQART